MSIAWSTMAAAIQNWVEAASGLPDAKVYWGQQSSARPAPPFITLRIASLRRVGHDWQEIEEDGADINLTVRGVREGVLSIQCFGATAVGDASSLAMINAVITKASLESRRAALNAAGIGIASFGPVMNLDGIVGVATFEPRAAVDVRFYLAEEVSETSTYIETVEVTNEITGGEFAVEIGA